LTGVAPWNAADARGTLAVAAAGELPDLALLAPEAPEELVRVVRRGLSPEPHQRGSAASFALDLRHACRPEPVRLPVAGVPDAELGRTGRGPRTDLTHQVPGRRPRSAHAAPQQAGRPARVRARLAARIPFGDDGLGVLSGVLRRAAVVGAVLVAVAAGLAGAAWAGASWGGHPGAPERAATGQVPTDPAASGPPVSDPTSSGPLTSESPTSESPASESPTSESLTSGPRTEPRQATQAPIGEEGQAGVPVADRAAAPADDAGWTTLLTDLYARRATAFTTADAQVLSGVYLAGSALLDRDTGQVRALADAGQCLAGFAPEVRRLLSVTRDGIGHVVLQLVDEMPGYRVVPVGALGATGKDVAGRGEASVRIVLEGTAAGWRISDARMDP
jgi:hypothetical protein